MEFKELEGAHSGENLAQVVDSLLKELGLGAKLLTITSDNASNNETMITALARLLEAQGIT